MRFILGLLVGYSIRGIYGLSMMFSTDTWHTRGKIKISLICQ
jgi:hypothetical protein